MPHGRLPYAPRHGTRDGDGPMASVDLRGRRGAGRMEGSMLQAFRVSFTACSVTEHGTALAQEPRR